MTIKRKWKWAVLAVGVFLLAMVVWNQISIKPIEAANDYVRYVVEGKKVDALSSLTGVAKNIANQQKDLLKTQGIVLNSSFKLQSIDYKLRYAIVLGDITVKLPDGTVDRQHQLFQLLKQDGIWKISRVENRSPLESTNFYIPAFFTDDAVTTVAKYLTDQLAGKKEAVQWLSGPAYTGFVTSQQPKVTAIEPDNALITPLGQEVFGDLLLTASYKLKGENVPKEMADKQIQLLIRMEKVGGAWKIKSLEPL